MKIRIEWADSRSEVAMKDAFASSVLRLAEKALELKDGSQTQQFYALAKDINAKVVGIDLTDYLEAQRLGEFEQVKSMLSHEVYEGGSSHLMRQMIETIRDCLSEYLKLPQPGGVSKFSWIGDPQFRTLLESDHEEAEACLSAGQFKACVVMSGSILEAALYELLRRDVSWTMDSSRASLPRRKGGRIPRIESNEVEEGWKLSELIKFVEDNNVLRKEVTDRVDIALRDSRNLIHPTAHLRSQLSDSSNLAKISAAALNIALDAISKARIPP